MPEGFDGEQSRQQRGQVVNFWNCQARFLEAGFEILFSALLAVKADGIRQGVPAQSCQ